MSRKRRVSAPPSVYDFIAGPLSRDMSFEEAMFRASNLRASQGRHVTVGLKPGEADGSNGYYKDGSVEVPGDVDCYAIGQGLATILDLEIICNSVGGTGRRSFEGISILQTSERPCFSMNNAGFALVKWLRCFLASTGTTNPAIDLLGNFPRAVFDEVQAQVGAGNPHGAIRQDGGLSQILAGSEFFHFDFDTHTSETISGTMIFSNCIYDGVVKAVGGLTEFRHCFVDAFQVGAGRPGTFAKIGSGATVKLRRATVDGADGVLNPVFDGLDDGGFTYGSLDRDETPVPDFAGATLTHASLGETIAPSL